MLIEPYSTYTESIRSSPSTVQSGKGLTTSIVSLWNGGLTCKTGDPVSDSEPHSTKVSV